MAESSMIIFFGEYCKEITADNWQEPLCEQEDAFLVLGHDGSYGKSGSVLSSYYPQAQPAPESFDLSDWRAWNINTLRRSDADYRDCMRREVGGDQYWNERPTAECDGVELYDGIKNVTLLVPGKYLTATECEILERINNYEIKCDSNSAEFQHDVCQLKNCDNRAEWRDLIYWREEGDHYSSLFSKLTCFIDDKTTIGPTTSVEVQVKPTSVKDPVKLNWVIEEPKLESADRSNNAWKAQNVRAEDVWFL